MKLFIFILGIVIGAAAVYMLPNAFFALQLHNEHNELGIQHTMLAQQHDAHQKQLERIEKKIDTVDGKVDKILLYIESNQNPDMGAK